MKAYVITIKDNKDSERMANRCIKTAKQKSNLEVEKFYAVTPKHNPVMLAEMFGIKTEPFLQNRYSRGENCLSCFLSHFTLWKMSGYTSEEILIFEHDAVVERNIPLDVEYKGVLSYGAPSYGSFKVPSSDGVHKLMSKQYLPGAHAYMVKPWAAKELVAVAGHDPEPTDVYIKNERFDFIQEYFPWPVVVKDEFSTVQNNVGVQAKHSFKANPSAFRLIDA